jgi:broad specificity phosphatase PhoE
MGMVLLVRHGQASFGADDYDVLSETGLEQSRLLGRFLAGTGLGPGAVLHGAMRRQLHPATATVDSAGWNVVPELDEGWNEFDHVAVVARAALAAGGDDPRLSDRREFQRLFEDATDRWAGGEHDAEYDEPWPVFLARVRAALERACARDGVSVVSSSGGPIAAACAMLVDPDGSPLELARLWGAFNVVTANASVTRVIQGSTGRRRLLTFNEHAYLPRELVTYR